MPEPVTGAAGSGRPLADVLVDQLVAAGITDVFAVASGAMTPLLRAINERSEIRYTGVRHEFAAATMAAAIFHATGRLALCLGEQGPGTLNLVSGMGVARNNNLALIAVTVSGRSATAYPGSGALMELDAPLLARAVTKLSTGVNTPDAAPGAMARALAEALDGCPGPVLVDIPRDILAAALPDPATVTATPATTTPLRSTGAVAQPVTTPDPELIARAAQVLSSSKRLLVIAGGGAAQARVAGRLRALAGRLGAATASTQMGMGVLPSDGPGFVGHGGVIAGPALIRAAVEADVVLAVGCRFSSWWWRGGKPLCADATVIRIDSDPRLADSSGVSLIGDAELVLGRFAELLQGPSSAPNEWVQGLTEELAAHRRRLEELASQRTAPAHPAALARQLADRLDPEDLVVLDGGHTTFWSNDFTPALEPRRVFHEPGMGHLGFGIPYANALAQEFPGRRVVTITGDGAFGFSLIELDTARRLGLRTITVIHNNALWGVISLAQRHSGFSLGTDIGGTDYAAIADGFGCLGIQVKDLADFDAAWDKALASEVPAVIDVSVRFEPHPTMPDFGRTT